MANDGGDGKYRESQMQRTAKSFPGAPPYSSPLPLNHFPLSPVFLLLLTTFLYPLTCFSYSQLLLIFSVTVPLLSSHPPSCSLPSINTPCSLHLPHSNSNLYSLTTPSMYHNLYSTYSLAIPTATTIYCLPSRHYSILNSLSITLSAPYRYSISRLLHSLIPSLSTPISLPHSNSNPIKIRRPVELAGKTLEWRLMNYDWKNHFQYFQHTTHTGTYNPMCWNRGKSIIPVSLEAFEVLSIVLCLIL